MNSIKCSRCGLRQIVSNGVCKQCNALLAADSTPKDKKLNAKIIIGIVASVIVAIILSIAIPKLQNNSSEETNLVSQFIPKKELELTGSIFIVTQGAENFKMGLVNVTVIPEDIITPHINSKKSNNEAVAKFAYEDAKQKATNAIITLGKAKDKYDSEVASLKSTLNNDRATIVELERNIERAKNLKWLEQDIRTAQTNSESSLIKVQNVLDKLNYEVGAARYFEGLPIGVAASTTDADGKFILKLSKAGKYAIAAKATRKISDKTEEYYWLFWIVVNGEPKTIMLSNNNLTDSGSPDSLIQTTKY